MATIKKRLLLWFLLILFLSMTVALLAYIFGLFREISQPVLPPPASPTTEVTPTAKRTFSSLANEADFLRLEKDLKTLKQDLETVDLSEAKLSLPILEMEINFEK